MGLGMQMAYGSILLNKRYFQEKKIMKKIRITISTTS